jgi:WD40 repeat protein
MIDTRVDKVWRLLPQAVPAIALGLVLLLGGSSAFAEPEPLPPGVVARLGSPKMRHGGRIHCLAFSPDGKTIATGGDDAVVRLWDAATGKQLRVSKRFSNPVASVSYHPKGKTLAVTIQDSETAPIYFLDATSCAEQKQVERRHVEQRDLVILGSRIERDLGPVVFAPDGKTFAAFGEGLTLWDSATLRKLHPIADIAASGVNVLVHNQFVFSPDGRRLAASGGEVVCLIDVAERKVVLTLEAKDRTVSALIFSRDGKRLITADNNSLEYLLFEPSAGEDPAIRVWDTATGKQDRVLKHDSLIAGVRTLALAPDGNTLAVATPKGIRLWDLKEGKVTRALSRVGDGREPVELFQFSPDRKRILGGTGNVICVWETASGRLLAPEANEAITALTAVAVSHDGRLLAAGSKDGRIDLWDLPARRLIRRLPGHAELVGRLVFAPDGKTLASRSENGYIRTWDVDSGRRLLEIKSDVLEKEHPLCLSYAPDGKLLASNYGSRYKYKEPNGIHLWDPKSGKMIEDLKYKNGEFDRRIEHIAFSAESSVLLAMTEEGALFERRREADRFTAARVIHDDIIATSAAFASDGTLATTSHEQEGVTVWQPKGNNRSWTLPGPNGHRRALAFSPDGRYLVSGASLDAFFHSAPQRDYTLRTYEMASGHEVRRWDLPANMEIGSFSFTPGSALAFTPDNRHLVTAMTDTTILVWDLFADDGKYGDFSTTWVDLKHSDARRAYRAMSALIAAGDKGVALLDRYLQAIKEPDPKQLAR